MKLIAFKQFQFETLKKLKVLGGLAGIMEFDSDFWIINSGALKAKFDLVETTKIFKLFYNAKC